MVDDACCENVTRKRVLRVSVTVLCFPGRLFGLVRPRFSAVSQQAIMKIDGGSNERASFRIRAKPITLPERNNTTNLPVLRTFHCCAYSRVLMPRSLTQNHSHPLNITSLSQHNTWLTRWPNAAATALKAQPGVSTFHRSPYSTVPYIPRPQNLGTGGYKNQKSRGIRAVVTAAPQGMPTPSNDLRAVGWMHFILPSVLPKI